MLGRYSASYCDEKFDTNKRRDDAQQAGRCALAIPPSRTEPVAASRSLGGAMATNSGYGIPGTGRSDAILAPPVTDRCRAG
jgi:hypothetical protein